VVAGSAPLSDLFDRRDPLVEVGRPTFHRIPKIARSGGRPASVASAKVMMPSLTPTNSRLLRRLKGVTAGEVAS